MSPLVWLAVPALGGVAAVARYVVIAATDRRWPSPIPLGTFVVNVSGAFAVGLLVGLLGPGDARVLLGVGVLGSFTTFSTWMVQTERLATAGLGRMATANIVLGVAVGLGAAALGRALAGL